MDSAIDCKCYWADDDEGERWKVTINKLINLVESLQR